MAIRKLTIEEGQAYLKKKQTRAATGKTIAEPKTTEKVFTEYDPLVGDSRQRYEDRIMAGEYLPEFGSYEYFVQREKEVGKRLDELEDMVPSDVEKIIRNYWEAKENGTLAYGYSHAALASESDLRKLDRAREDYKQINDYLEKFEEDDKGVELTKDGEIDVDAGIKKAEKKSEIANRLSRATGVPAYLTLNKNYTGGKYDEARKHNKEALLATETKLAYEYYDDNKDNDYSDNFISRAIGNYKLGRIGVKTNKAGALSYGLGTDDLEAVEVYQALSDKIYNNNKKTFENGWDAPTDFWRNAPMQVDQFLYSIEGRILGGAAGLAVGGLTGLKQGQKLGAAYTSAKYMQSQTVGASYIRLLQEEKLSVEDAKVLAENEAFLSGLVEFGLEYGSEMLWGGGKAVKGAISKKAGKEISEEATEEAFGEIGKSFAQKLVKRGMSEKGAEKAVRLAKTAGKLGLEALGEGTEEGLQEAVSIATDRVARNQGSGSKGDIIKEAVNFSAYTDEELEQIWESAKAGATVSVVGAGYKAGINKVTNKVINKVAGEPSSYRKNSKTENVIEVEDGKKVKYESVSFSNEQSRSGDTVSLAKKIWDKRNDVISGENVFEVNESSIEKAETPSMGIFNLFKKWGGKVVNPELGTVELNKRGAKDTTLHGIGKEKYIASAAIKDVIEKGKIIDKQKNWKSRGYDTYVIAAEGNVNGEKSLVGVVVKNYPNNPKLNNKFYIHEVIKLGATSAQVGENSDSTDFHGMELAPTNTISRSDEKVKVSGVELLENGKKIYNTIKPGGDAESFNKAVSEYYKMGLSGISFDKAR